MMRNAETILDIIRQRGQRGLPVTDAYRLRYQRDLSLRAYGKQYRHHGAMTPGSTAETVDGMSLEKIDAIIDALRQERYRWTPVRRTYVPKKSGKWRPLGLPSWSDTLLQEGIRVIWEAYDEPQCSDRAHGCRPHRGCHPALRDVRRHGQATKWFIEGDLCACFDRIEQAVLEDILPERFHDNRFLRLMRGLLKAGYLEEWTFNATYSGVPQGGVVSPILSNIVRDRLDKSVAMPRIPVYTSGHRRRMNPPSARLLKQADKARNQGDWPRVQELRQQAQRLPSRDPHDPDCRRLWEVRYAADMLVGCTGSKGDAEAIKQQLTTSLREELHLALSAEKTLVPHAREDRARFLGYEVHVLHADDKYDHRGQRCINGSIGRRVPPQIHQAKRARYLRRDKLRPLPQRTIDDAPSRVAQYQAEYRGVGQYYRLAYHLHVLSHLKYVMEVSLVQTFAKKYKTTCPTIYKRYGATIDPQAGPRRVWRVTIERDPPTSPLTTYFGGVSLPWKQWACRNDAPTKPIGRGRSEVVERLLAQVCELCGAQEHIEVHHIRKLADLASKTRDQPPRWKRRMVARQRKTLVVCRSCHERIQYGHSDGPALRRSGYRRAS